MTTLIVADDTWTLMALTCGWVAFSIYAEQTWQWASKLSGAIIALLGAMFLTNFNIIPVSAPWFDTVVWGYVVPLAIPLLLLQCDIRKIWLESGRVLGIYLIGAFGTALSAIIAFYLLADKIPHSDGVAGMMTGSYIGGSINLVTLATAFKLPGEVLAATAVADNMIMALYFFMLISMPSIAFFRRNYRHPILQELEQNQDSNTTETRSASFWHKKPISLKDIAYNIALSAIIIAVSEKLSFLITSLIPATNFFTSLLGGMLGNKYVLITTFSMLVATFASKRIEKMGGSQEIGTFLIYLFLFTIGVPASISIVLTTAPWLFAFCFIMVFIHLLITLIFGKLFNFTLEEIILSSNANIGGPTTAAALAISQGWTKLVAPIMLVGTLGYVLGTYAGFFIGSLFGIQG